MPLVQMDVLCAGQAQRAARVIRLAPFSNGLSASMAAADPNYMSTAASPYPIKRE